MPASAAPIDRVVAGGTVVSGAGTELADVLIAGETDRGHRRSRRDPAA